MGFRTCPGCEAVVESGGNFCPKCGAELKSKNGKEEPSAQQIAYIILGIIFLGFTAYGIYVNNVVFNGGLEAPPPQPPTAAEIRKSTIERQFSGFDGSHRNLVSLVKDTMNDPDSFEHVETGYVDEGQTIRVRMVYRGKNIFGGIVTEQVIVRTTIDGDVIEIIEQP